MSIKMYNGLIIKNADYKEIFNNMMNLKNDLTKEIEKKYIKMMKNLLESLKREQDKNGFIDLNEFDESLKEYMQRMKVETIYDFVFYYTTFFHRNKTKISLDNSLKLLDSSICLFPNGNDILVLKYINFQDFDNIINKYLKLEDYSYYDNSDAPYEILKKNEEGYVSKRDWNKRRLDWENVLLENSNSIPSQNSIQLVLEYDKIVNFGILLLEPEIKEKYSIKINFEKELENNELSK